MEWGESSESELESPLSVGGGGRGARCDMLNTGIRCARSWPL